MAKEKKIKKKLKNVWWFENKLYLCCIGNESYTKTNKIMTLEQAFNQLEELNLNHRDHVAIMKIVAAYGRDEYSRGFDRADEMNKEFENQLKTQ